MIKKDTSVQSEIKDNRTKIACSNCNCITNHEILTRTIFTWDAHGDIQGRDVYETLSCLGCEEISFRIVSSDSDSIFEMEDGTWEHSEIEKIYPQRVVGRSLMSDLYSLPLNVRNIYVETHSALCSNLSILSAVGIRALVESVCKEEHASGKDLKEKIDNLATQGLLTSKNASVLHQTRFLGNRAAHEMQIPKDKELSIAFDIIENLLEMVYIIPNKAESLKRSHESH